ncbi:MAG TPA: type II toxin-antitoxin system RelE/ParE family toxin [Fluviicoccus sp.]|nr:type II toxin-antitoxin system RelE/ParE family toxin [Fluviicoccus sp.]
MVRWTAHAKAQLRRIHDYIAEDSPLYAKRVTAELVQQTVGLDELPRKGKKVPELNEESVREVSLSAIGSCTKLHPTALPCWR